VTNYRTIVPAVNTAARVGRALASPIRIRALLALRERELCLCQLVEIFAVAPSTMSKHMSVLGDCGLVQSRREGRWTHYRLPDEPDREIAGVLQFVINMAGGDPAVRDDAARIRDVDCR
jgi:ArsR family transcriptional regulator